MIPGIADFFGTSADELLGIGNEEKNNKLHDYDNEYAENNKNGKIWNNIELSRNVLINYPRNFQWMINLAYSLLQYNANEEQIDYSSKHNFINEAIELAERVLEDCTDEQLRLNAIQLLCYNYPIKGKKEKALELADKLPEIYMTRGAILGRIYDGEERVKQEQENLLQMIDYCGNILSSLSYNKKLTNKDKIKYIEASNSLYQIILQGDENSLFYSCRLCRNYQRLAELTCADSNINQTMFYLLLAEKSANLYDKCALLGEQKFSSLFVNMCNYNPENSGKNWEGTEISLLYNKTTESIFDKLRDLPEFQKLQQRLRYN